MTSKVINVELNSPTATRNQFFGHAQIYDKVNVSYTGRAQLPTMPTNNDLEICQRLATPSTLWSAHCEPVRFLQAESNRLDTGTEDALMLLP
jgi:hypothetical protein